MKINNLLSTDSFKQKNIIIKNTNNLILFRTHIDQINKKHILFATKEIKDLVTSLKIYKKLLNYDIYENFLLSDDYFIYECSCYEKQNQIYSIDFIFYKINKYKINNCYKLIEIKIDNNIEEKLYNKYNDIIVELKNII